jgi:hypothetical protein
VSRTLQTIFANSYPSFEVLLIDQNKDEMVRSSLREQIDGKRIRYFHSPKRGLAHGRNFAVPKCRGEIIACTDDNCDVSSDWLPQIGRAFKTAGRVGLVF